MIMVPLILVSCGNFLIASEITDEFTEDGPDIVWAQMWADSMSTPLEVVEDASAPSGDGYVGQMTVDLDYAALGVVYGGSASMTDYAIEAEVYLEMNSGYRQSLMTRFGTDGDEAWAYEMSGNFYAPYMASQIQFRRWNSSSSAIEVLAIWDEGMPSEDGWHNMRIESVGNTHTCYLDGVELGTVTDDSAEAAIASGYYGIYCWDMFSDPAASIKVDNWVVEPLEHEDAFTEDGPDIVWAQMWADSMSTPLEVVEDASAPSGDGYVGQMTVDLDYAALGVVYGGSASMTDYAIEAEVYLEMNSGYRQSLMTRFGTDGDEAWAYEMSGNFYAPYMASQIQFRRWNSSSSAIEVLAIWDEGMPSEDGWHNMRIESVGNTHTCYLDGVELGTVTDDSAEAAIASGYYGIYCWDMFSDPAASIKVDNWVVETVGTVGIDEPVNNIPNQFSLKQNYPNPFNPTTNIAFELSKAMNVSLDIFNLNGQLVRNLIHGNFSPGQQQVAWDGKNNRGEDVPTGVYLYTLTGNSQRVSNKMIFLK